MKLLEPIKIGKLEVKNRIVMSPMSTHYTENGYVTERLINFYEARAKGGVGLIIVEDGIVDSPVGKNVKNALVVDEDKYIPMLKKLSSAIKKHGAKAALQLSHAGRRAGRINLKTGCLEITNGHLPVAPSIIAHPCPGHVTPRELSIEEIEEIVEKFGQAARRAIEAGFDIISLHCAHMYLCGQFLSPWANKRKDKYGGSLENRLRFVLEVIKRIKQETGDDHPLICRMNGQEPEGGNTLSEIREIAHRLEQAGIAAINVSTGFGAVLKERGFISAEAPIGTPEGCIVHLAENVKKAVSIPVIAVNKIRDVNFAESILQQNRADMIALGRPLLADPDWVNKVKEGRYEDIRPCISCCQGCVDHVLKDLPITCTLNPSVGREGEVSIQPVQKGKEKKVLVVGGGPGGLEAAIICAERGHKVTVWEREGKIGGQVLLAEKPPRKAELHKIVDYFERRLKQLGVQVEVNKKADKEMVRKFNPDVVILATGSRSVKPPIPGINGSNVQMARDLLKNEKETGTKVAIIGGGQVGVETAEWLAEKGKKVTVIELLEEVARDMPLTVKVPLIINLEDYGVRILTNTRAKEIRPEGVLVERKNSEDLIEADTIVIAVGAESENSLEVELKDSGISVYSIGDCKTPGKIIDAIHEGFKVGLQI